MKSRLKSRPAAHDQAVYEPGLDRLVSRMLVESGYDLTDSVVGGRPRGHGRVHLGTLVATPAATDAQET